jgi:hypothetical protein
MTALLYRTATDWRLMLAMSDIRTGFVSAASARNYATTHGIKVRRSSNLDH